MQSVRLLLDCICVSGTSRDLKSVCEKTVVGDTVCLVSGMGRGPKDTVHRVSSGFPSNGILPFVQKEPCGEWFGWGTAKIYLWFS